MRDRLNAGAGEPVVLEAEDVHMVLQHVNPNEAAGPDKVKPRVFKVCADQLAYILTAIFNLSLKTCTVPLNWKTSCTVPLNWKTSCTVPLNWKTSCTVPLNWKTSCSVPLNWKTSCTVPLNWKTSCTVPLNWKTSCTVPLNWKTSCTVPLNWKTSCTVPLNWKTSCIVPVPKKPVVTAMNDLRPIAITSAVMKVFERLVLRRLQVTSVVLADVEKHLKDTLVDAMKEGKKFRLVTDNVNFTMCLLAVMYQRLDREKSTESGTLGAERTRPGRQRADGNKVKDNFRDCSAARYENGKSTDTKHAYSGERIVIFNLTRSQEDHINYEIIESIKNVIIFSPKYESGMKIFEPPHVVVFANFSPNLSKLSQDRWDIRFNSDESLTETAIETVVSLEEVGKKEETEKKDKAASSTTTESTDDVIIISKDSEQETKTDFNKIKRTFVKD
nr:hypothetical protein BaRGS_018034 [Batillaria attramentaria]